MSINNFEIIKQSLGNVIYSQKTHEMAIIRKSNYILCIKWINIILVGIVFFVLFLHKFLIKMIRIIYMLEFFFTVVEALFLIFQLSFNPEKEVLEHKNTTNNLWLIREKH